MSRFLNRVAWPPPPLSIEHGGTGASTQPGAANNILPPQAGHNGDILFTDGSNVSWISPGSGGIVTSVINSDSSLTIYPTIGDVTASINLAHSNVWSASQSIVLADSSAATDFLINPAIKTSGSLFKLQVNDVNKFVVDYEGKITSATWNGTTIETLYGGTGLTSYSKGDLIYASAINTLSQLTSAGHLEGQVLKLINSGGSLLPEWSTHKASVGVVSTPSPKYTENSDGTITVDCSAAPVSVALRSTSDFSTPIVSYSLTGSYGPFTIVPTARNYIYIAYNGGSPAILHTTDVSLINESDSTPYITVGRIDKSGTANITDGGAGTILVTVTPALTQHGLVSTWDEVTIAGAVDLTYNGTFTVTRIDAYSFKITPPSGYTADDTCTWSSIELDVLDWDEPGSGLQNKLHRRFVKTQRFARESGLELSEDTGRVVVVPTGVAWYGGKAITMAATRSDTTTSRTYQWHHVGGVWTKTITTQYNNSQFDDGTDTQSLSPGRFVANWIYRDVSDTDRCLHIILGHGTGTGHTVLETIGEVAPTSAELPPEMSVTAMLLGRIIARQGSETAEQIDSVFDLIAYPSEHIVKTALDTVTGYGVVSGMSLASDNESWTDLEIDAADNTKIKSTGSTPRAFAAGDIGKIITVTAGVGFTTGAYTITAGPDLNGFMTLSGAVGIVGSVNGSATIAAFKINSGAYYTPSTGERYYTTETKIALPNILTHLVTYVALDVDETVIQHTSPFTDAERRSQLFLGVVVHSNHISVNAVNNLPDVGLAALSQYNDLLDALKGFNDSGNDFEANGANLQINKTAGTLFKRGVNFANDTTTPHVITTGALTAPANLRFRTQTGVETADLNYIDSGFYDLAGVRTAVSPAGRFQIMRIALFPSNLVRIQYGQQLYVKMSDAFAGLATEPFVVEQNINENGLFRAILVVQGNATALNDSTQAQFIMLNRFGDVPQAAGVTGGVDLQRAYENSLPNPEILTNLINGALNIRRGTAADTDSVWTVQNNAGDSVAIFDANGLLTLGADLATNVPGSIKMWGAGANSWFTSFITGTQTANVTYTLPTAMPTLTGQALVSTDAGVMSWATVTTPPAGLDTYIQYNNSGVFGAEAEFTYNYSTNLLAVGETSISSNVITMLTSDPKIFLRHGQGNLSVYFSGLGLNDLTANGPYIGAEGRLNTYDFIIAIDSVSGPVDTFQWTSPTNIQTFGVAITGAAQYLTDGVSITFASTTGHTLGEYWTIIVDNTDLFQLVNAAGTVAFNVQNDGRIGSSLLNASGLPRIPILAEQGFGFTCAGMIPGGGFPEYFLFATVGDGLDTTPVFRLMAPTSLSDGTLIDSTWWTPTGVHFANDIYYSPAGPWGVGGNTPKPYATQFWVTSQGYLTGAGGSDTYVQYNASGVLTGDSGLTYQAGTSDLYVAGSISIATSAVMTPNVADGALAVAYLFDSLTELTNAAGAKNLVVANGTVEKFSVNPRQTVLNTELVIHPPTSTTEIFAAPFYNIDSRDSSDVSRFKVDSDGNVTMSYDIAIGPTTLLLDAPPANGLIVDTDAWSPIIEFESKLGDQSAVMEFESKVGMQSSVTELETASTRTVVVGRDRVRYNYDYSNKIYTTDSTDAKIYATNGTIAKVQSQSAPSNSLHFLIDNTYDTLIDGTGYWWAGGYRDIGGGLGNPGFVVDTTAITWWAGTIYNYMDSSGVWTTNDAETTYAWLDPAQGLNLYSDTMTLLMGATTPYLKFNPGVASSGTSIAYLFDTVNNLNTPGDRLVSIQNQTVEKFSISDTDVTSLVLFTAPDVFVGDLNRSDVTYFSDLKMATGVPFSERQKFKIAVTYSGGNVTATISFVGAYTDFSYYISGKKFTVTSTELAAYTATTASAEGVWFFYINNTTVDVAAPVMILSLTPWVIYDPDVLLWDFYFNASDNSITWVGEERHTAGRDIFNHARNHAQGAQYKNGLLINHYNNLTTLSANTDDNFGRALVGVSNGSFYDEDIFDSIAHADTAYTSTVAAPATNWNLIVSQFLGFTDTNSSVVAGTLTFPASHTLVTGQPLTVFQGNTTTVRGTFTVTLGGTGASFSVTTVTGSNAFANNDVVVVGSRIPIYYISSVAGSTYTWRKLATTEFLGVSGGAAYTTANIASGAAQYNDPSVGGWLGITANRYYPVYLAATNSTSEPVIAIMGQSSSTSSILTTVLTENAWNYSSLVGLAGLSIQEVVPFYRLTFYYNTTGLFSNTRIKLVDAMFINIRVSTVSGSIVAPASISNHALLTNLEYPTSEHTYFLGQDATWTAPVVGQIPYAYDVTAPTKPLFLGSSDFMWATELSITKNNITTTSTDALRLKNTTVSLVGTQVQQSPNLMFENHVWDLDGAVDDKWEWFVYTKGTATNITTNTMYFDVSKNDAAATTPASLTSDGALYISKVIGPVFEKTFGFDGVLVTFTGARRWYPSTAITVISCTASVNTAPTGATVLVDVDKNINDGGATIFTTQANRPEIAISGYVSAAEVPDITSFLSSDYMTVDVDQIGSTIAGSDITVTIRYTYA